MLVVCESYSEAINVLAVFSTIHKIIRGELEYTYENIMNEMLDSNKLKKGPFSIMVYHDVVNGENLPDRYAILYGFDPKDYS